MSKIVILIKANNVQTVNPWVIDFTVNAA
jgi:hypothetical protein